MAGIRGMKWGKRKEEQLIRLHQRSSDIAKYLKNPKAQFRGKYSKRLSKINKFTQSFINRYWK